MIISELKDNKICFYEYNKPYTNQKGNTHSKHHLFSSLTPIKGRWRNKYKKTKTKTKGQTKSTRRSPEKKVGREKERKQVEEKEQMELERKEKKQGGAEKIKSRRIQKNK